MSDSTLNRFLASGTAAERAAFTPDPQTPATGPDPTYFWFETDTGLSYAWDFGGSTWEQVSSPFADTLKSHRAWRLKFTDSNSGTFCTLAEIAFQDAGGGAIATSGGDVVGANCDGGFPASNAFDGNLSSLTSSSVTTLVAKTNDNYMSVGYQWATTKAVGKVVVTAPTSSYNVNNSPKNFAIQYSDDLGASWVTYSTVSGQTGWSANEVRTFTLPATGIAFQ